MTLEKSAGWPRRYASPLQALLDQRRELLLAHPLATARQRRTVEDQLVPEKLLAAEQLIVRVLDTARAKILVGEIVHVLEDRKPAISESAAADVRPCRNRPRRTAPRESTVDRPAELRQRVIEVDDLVEAGPEKIVLPALSPLPGPHRITLRQADGETESRSSAPSNSKKSSPQTLPSSKCNNLPIHGNASKISASTDLHDDNPGPKGVLRQS